MTFHATQGHDGLEIRFPRTNSPYPEPPGSGLKTVIGVYLRFLRPILRSGRPILRKLGLI
jgi:hypothetical protein